MVRLVTAARTLREVEHLPKDLMVEQSRGKLAGLVVVVLEVLAAALYPILEAEMVALAYPLLLLGLQSLEPVAVAVDSLQFPGELAAAQQLEVEGQETLE